MTATEGKLGDLHDKVADVLIGALDRSEKLATATGEEVFPIEVNPALISVATKFLKDNEITCQAGEGSKTQELQEQLNKRRRTVNNVTHL